MKLIIERYSDSGVQTIGDGFVVDFDGFSLFEFKTLELSWKDNQNMISCIPIGKYKVVKRYSSKYKNHFHILDVEGRSFILIHSGNFHYNTKGCVLVGSSLEYLNKDEEVDVANSQKTLDQLLDLLPDSFELEITSRV